MRRFTLIIVGLAFAFCALAFATDKPSVVPYNTHPAKAAPIKTRKETRVSFTGIVKEITDTTIMVERTVKGSMEAMEFALDKPAANIKVGDKVKVSYVKKEGKNIAMKVAPVVVKRIIKKAIPPKEIKPAPIEAAPSKK
ncbi:MAG: hypothetical protein NTZ24_01520 [Deltaproteobacteria bacterium]|nr:hypothetical protein [Deltaproteobacteria bacterium]